MTKQELVDAVAKDTGIGNKEAGAAVTTVFKQIEAALAKGEEVNVPGFGKFSVGERSARTGKNPQTGAAIEIAAGKTPKFKAGAGLKRAVAGE